MVRILISVLLVLALTSLYGCAEERRPEWLKFGRPKIEKKPKVEQPEGTLLASVNGRIITLGDFNQRIQAYNSEIQAAPDIPDSVKSNYLIETFEDKKKVLEEMIEREMLIGEAIERGLDKNKDLVQAVETLEKQFLFARLIEIEKSKVSLSTKEVENFYNLNKEVFAVPEERKVSMIVVPAEQKAKEILITLLQGNDFATLARANSTDKSASKGGDIGFIVRKSPFPQPDKKMMFEKFEEIAFTLELHKPSAIFKGPQGSYIIKVAEIKQARQRLLSEVYNDIEQGLMLRKQGEALEALVSTLRKSADIIVDSELLRD
jgi:parvulin-like peptidyl-prolyl isomerase